jgi:hypothetical protein
MFCPACLGVRRWAFVGDEARPVEAPLGASASRPTLGLITEQAEQRPNKVGVEPTLRSYGFGVASGAGTVIGAAGCIAGDLGAMGADPVVISGADALCSIISELGPLLRAMTKSSTTTATPAIIHVVGAQR